MDVPKNKDGITERRRCPRVDASFVEYSPEKPASKKISTFTKNMSVYGICLLLSEVVELNTFVNLTIYLFDGGDPIEVKGKVVWTKPSPILGEKDKSHFETGIQYIGLSEEDGKRILNYIIKTLKNKMTS